MDFLTHGTNPDVAKHHEPKIFFMQPAQTTKTCVVQNTTEKVSYNYWVKFCPCEIQLIVDQIKRLVDYYLDPFGFNQSAVLAEKHQVDLVPSGFNHITVGCRKVGGISSFFVYVTPGRADLVGYTKPVQPKENPPLSYYFHLPTTKEEIEHFLGLLQLNVFQNAPCKIVSLKTESHRIPPMMPQKRKYTKKKKNVVPKLESLV